MLGTIACREEKTASRDSRPSVVSVSYLSSPIMDIKLLGSEGTELVRGMGKDVSTSILDYGPGAQYETNETKSWPFQDFNLNDLKILQVQLRDGRSIDVDATTLTWTQEGPLTLQGVTYKESYSTEIHTRSHPLITYK